MSSFSPAIRAVWGRARFWRVPACVLLLAVTPAGASRAQEAEDEAGEGLLAAFEIEASAEVFYERLQNFDLDSRVADDVDLLSVELQFEVLFEPNDYFLAYFNPKMEKEHELSEEGEGERRDAELTIEEAYVTVTQPDWNLSLQAGRQAFQDEREWWYDDELDALRGRYEADGVLLELSASRETLFRRDLLNPDGKDQFNNYILHGAAEVAEEITLGAYGILRDDRNSEDDEPLFLGLSAAGTIGERLTYWLDAAHVRGREDDTKIRGYGVDLLGAYAFEAPLSPYLVLGYAFGTGDPDPDDDRDRAFRQTDLQGNETELGGMTSFLAYGEAFDPELSNMSIFTAGLGARPSENSSIDLVYHYYLQDEASDELRDAAFEADPTGLSRRLGSEIDLVIGYEEIEDLRITGFLGYFLPGRAFAKGADPALLARIEIEYEF